MFYGVFNISQINEAPSQGKQNLPAEAKYMLRMNQKPSLTWRRLTCSSRLSKMLENLITVSPWHLNTLTGPDQWISYEAMLTSSMPEEEEINDFAVFKILVPKLFNASSFPQK